MRHISKYALVLVLVATSGILYVQYFENQASGIEDINICTWKDSTAFAVTLSFDDGYLATYRSSLPILNSHHLVGTFNVIAKRVGSRYIHMELATWEDWNDAAKEGHEMASHSAFHRHLPDLTQEELLTELKDSQSIIESFIPEQKTLSFVYPAGEYDLASKKVVREYYISARSSDIGFNSISPSDFFSLKSMVISKDTSAQEINGWADEVEQEGYWLIEMYHLVNDSNPTNYELYTSPSILGAHLDHLSEKEVWVATQQSVVKYIKERDDSKITVVSEKRSKMVLRLVNDLDNRIFDQPLTIRARVPRDWDSVKVVQDDDTRIIEADAADYIYFDAVPGAGDISLSRVKN